MQHNKFDTYLWSFWAWSWVVNTFVCCFCCSDLTCAERFIWIIWYSYLLGKSSSGHFKALSVLPPGWLWNFAEYFPTWLGEHWSIPFRAYHGVLFPCIACSHSMNLICSTISLIPIFDLSEHGLEWWIYSFAVFAAATWHVQRDVHE